ncbi:MAG TPA: argininosuccinate lyase [Bacteroidia bacterium]|jgi:argininosuccinate lyase|nr:argininosuccinate lyase [Bacteroidia bacterium]
MKLWSTQSSSSILVNNFTVGNDRGFDLELAECDVLGSIAHAKMLCAAKLISPGEEFALTEALKEMLVKIREGTFSIDENCEDIHSQVEFLLTEQLGETGKKIHTARSRNDQSLLDIKLFCRKKIKQLTADTEKLFRLLITLSEKHKDDLVPGYTHLQLAMPSSFGLWFAAYAESLCDDLELLLAAYHIADKNPLGSAAGYGSSFAIDRELTTSLLGFSGMNVNSVYAQMTRGKTEKTVANAVAGIAATLSKMAMDCTLFMNQHFGFISFPGGLTTGSSIMPHKKNPDVFELIRGKCNRLQALPNEFALLLGNLPSGYHREFQLTKEILFPAFNIITDCMSMMMLMLENVEVKKNILEDENFNSLFTVDKVNQLVASGMSFRDAYHEVSAQVNTGTFTADRTSTTSHTGSINNPGNSLIVKDFEAILARFSFGKAEEALERLKK